MLFRAAPTSCFILVSWHSGALNVYHLISPVFTLALIAKPSSTGKLGKVFLSLSIN
jgi:hypothetical protein